MEKEVSCPVCQAITCCYPDYKNNSIFYECPVCGRYETGPELYYNQYNLNHLSAYLAYNAFHSEARYHTTKDVEECNRLRESGEYHPIHMDPEIVENWYPKSFSDKIDHILMFIYNHAPHIGQSVCFSKEQLYSFLFIDRYDLSTGKNILRSEPDLQQEGIFILTCLEEQNYIQGNHAAMHCDDIQNIILLPSAFARIDEVQKQTTNGKNALVAMKFGEDTKPLREAIRKGITDSGYIAIFIDEVQHNDFITPELLKYIKDSKFVVVDLTHQNNGAYFEEGYAMGLGKPVIQLCQKNTKLHFDIAQKNTIIWESEEDIPERLHNRIISTIE